MPYQTDQWITRRWETDTRYYVVEVCQDLFGCWLLKRSWGGRRNRWGHNMTIHAEDYTDALAMLEEVAKRRRARGYTHV